MWAPAVKILLLVLVLAAFGALSAIALAEVGYLGILLPQFQSAGGVQVLVDLVIALTLAMLWMVADARRHRRVVWPWLVATLLLGSFGPLGYLLAGALRERRAGRSAALDAGPR
jgi:hypothetical protein